MSEVEFIDEPPPSSGRWDRLRRDATIEFAETLRHNPGRWAIYPWSSTSEAARAVATRISNGKNKSFGDGFEATARGTTVYVRYQGEK